MDMSTVRYVLTTLLVAGCMLMLMPTRQSLAGNIISDAQCQNDCVEERQKCYEYAPDGTGARKDCDRQEGHCRQRCNQPVAVTVYADEYFGGNSHDFRSLGCIRAISDVGAQWRGDGRHSAVSSFRVHPGYKAELFQDVDCRGTSTGVVSAGERFSVHRQTPVGNDEVDSIRIMKAD